MHHIQSVEENALTYYKGIARLLNGNFIETDEIAWFTTGRRSLFRFNGILRSPTRVEDLAKIADPILETFTSQRLPFFWVDWQEGRAPGLVEYLNSKSIRLEHIKGMPVMSRGLEDLPEIPFPKDVETTRVQSQQDQDNWLSVLMEGFDEPESSRADFQQIIARSLTEPEPVFEHFIARWRGEPCAISTLLRAEYGAGIYHVATQPQYRGKKLGKALTLAAMQSARDVGYQEAILFATPSGFPIYQQLGFQTVSIADAFVWSGSE